MFCSSSLESPRWLISCNRGEKALEVLDRMAAANKKDLQVILQEIKEKNEPIFKVKIDKFFYIKNFTFVNEIEGSAAGRSVQ